MTIRHLVGPCAWTNEEGVTTWVRDVYDVEGRLRRTRPSRVDEIVEGWVTPGLVDVHAHLGYGPRGITPVETAVLDGRSLISVGILDVRDCGVPARANDALTTMPGLPRIIRCGQHLARPKRYIRGLGLDLDDPADLPAAVAEQARASDGWVKIVGDWIDRSGGREAVLRPLWEEAVLCDAVAAAHEAGARVAVHTFSHRTIDALLTAGVDSIEHGTGMSREHMDEAKQAGIAVTPTLLQVGLFADFAAQAGEKYPRYRDEMAAMHASARTHFEELVDSCVTLLPGTDSGGYQRFGSLADELARWAEWGCPPERIVEAATWGVRQFLGLDVLAEGRGADYVVYSSDPTLDAGVFARPAWVVIGGRRVR